MDSNFIKKYTLNKQVCPINFKPTEAYIYIYIYAEIKLSSLKERKRKMVIIQ